MRNKGFEGWYFKHQAGDTMLALIPGQAESGAFLQVMSTGGARQFSLPSLTVSGGEIRAGDCRFSREGVLLDLPGLQGEIRYGRFTPLKSDIMGPFRFFPMQCRHGVISMGHTIQGSVTLDGVPICLDGGQGYLEKDSGTSFPRAYLWMQCNDFPEECAIMVSIAQVPFAGLSFPGCICAIVYRGAEYRLATYRGVRIRAAEARHIRLSQGKLLLELDIAPSHPGHALQAPVRGVMSGRIRESCNALVHARLWENGRRVFDLRSSHAAYEAVAQITPS